MATLGPKNKIGPPGKDGQDGATGRTGARGRDGMDGAPGSKWHSGKGIPPAVLGRTNDMYLDITTGNVWDKSALGWTKKGNIKGGMGATLAGSGEAMPSGETLPTTYTLAPSETKAIDTLDLGAFTRALYSLTVFSRIENKNRAFEMLVTNEFSNVTDQVFNRGGTPLNFSVSAAKASSSMVLSITNNEAYALSVGYLKKLI
jgi:hypothetical protein